jgi:alkanesulfonate monooxygenase SsuD/methylene tetrahydromethanopterin reductase-like flavin-dependent oxidoreductase (luciferase family)
VKTDLLLDTFGATWDQVRAGALAAEEAGVDGVWVQDHLCGTVHGEPHVLECWSVLGALAPLTERVSLGPLVANMANRHPGVLAQMAATLQQVSAGRLLLGVGAGAGPRSGYAIEDRALGRASLPDSARRDELRRYVSDVREFWSRGEGFLVPSPPPPIIIGALGPRMASLAGDIGDGVNLFASGRDIDVLVATARGASSRPGFLVTVLTPFDQHWLDTDGPSRRRLSDLGVDHLILTVKPPYLSQIATMQHSGLDTVD